MALSSPRNPVRRPLAVLAAVLAGGSAAVGCGDDSADPSSSTTASSTTVSTAPTSTSPPPVGRGGRRRSHPGDIGGEQRTLTIEACQRHSSSMELTAHDDSGNQMMVKVAGGQTA